MKRKFVLFTLLFFSISLLFADSGRDFHKKGHKNFHGKRMMDEEESFSLIFIKTSEHSEHSYNFGLVFSQPVNPASIINESFLLNENEIQLKKIRFSKNYRIIDFFVDFETAIHSDETIELVIKDIESINGNKIEPVVIKNFKLNKEYRLMKKD